MTMKWELSVRIIRKSGIWRILKGNGKPTVVAVIQMINLRSMVRSFYSPLSLHQFFLLKIYGYLNLVKATQKGDKIETRMLCHRVSNSGPCAAKVKH